MSDTYFLTGALGCIGAWVVRTLALRGDRPVIHDLGQDTRRLADLLDPDVLEKLTFVRGDITEYAALRDAIRESGASKIIHLAGLQVPFCKADPARGALVNVLGTIHIFQAAHELGLERVVYASSAAVYGPPPDERAPAVSESDVCEPLTHYGVYKRANEGNARVFWQDSGVSSIGLRPLTVYGVGRDQGLTSGPTRAMKAAVLGRPFHIPFSGSTDFNFAGDTAAAFVECADRGPEGAHVFNLHGDSVEVERIVRLIEANAPEAAITISGPQLPIPSALDGSRLDEALPGLPRTSIEDGVRMTLDRFRFLQEAGRLSAHDLE